MNRVLNAVVGILAVTAVVCAIFFRNGNDNAQQSPPPSEPTQGVAQPVKAPVEPSAHVDQLIDRVMAFEIAFNTRNPDDTTSSVRARIRNYASREYMDWVGLDLTTKPERALALTGDRLEVEVAKSGVDTGESDDPDVAYVRTTGLIVRYNDQNKVVDRMPFVSDTTWAYTPRLGWRVYPSS